MEFIIKSWFFISLTAYFLLALAAVIDKYLLDKRISRPTTYAFYVGVFGLMALFLFPFGFFVPLFATLVLSLSSGFISILAFYSFYVILQKSEASRVVPVIGGFSPIFVLILSSFFLGESLKAIEYPAFFFLISGGVLISLAIKYDGIHVQKPETVKIFIATVISAFLFALSFVFFKAAVFGTPFINAFIWSRLGGFSASLIFLIPIASRQNIFATPKTWFSGFSVKKLSGSEADARALIQDKRMISTGSLFAINKIIGATGFFLLNYAISIGKVSIVNAMQGVQYALVFIIALLLSRKYPDILREDFSSLAVLEKILGIGLVAGGLLLLALG